MIRAICIALLCTPLAACGFFGGSDEATAEAPESQFAPQVPQVIDSSEVTRDPLELQAWADGNRVRFQLANNGIPSVPVSAGTFGLIVRGSDEIIRASEENVVTLFRPSRVRAGSQIVGEIIFVNHDDLVGERLVFNAGAQMRTFATIRPTL